MSLQTSAGRLRPATRAAMGVLHPGCLRLGSSARVEAFALGILRRHSWTHAGVAPVEAVLRVRPDASVASVFQMINTLALRIDLVIQRAASPRVPATGRSLSSSTHVVERVDRERSPDSPGRAILERLFAREVRLETLPARESSPAPATGRAAASAMPAGAPEPAGWSPVDMVLRRDAVAAPSAESSSPAARTIASTATRGVAGLDAARTTPLALASSPLSASELGRLTDEVVRKIDHRIIAQRERKGVI